MAADLIFFCMHLNCPLWPRFRVNILLNFLHDNEVIRVNLYAYKRILNERPFMNKVYSLIDRNLKSKLKFETCHKFKIYIYMFILAWNLNEIMHLWRCL